MSDKSKLVYICSPYATGDVQENVEKAKEYCKLALKEGFIPVAPHLLYPQFLRDDDPAERDQGISCGLALLEVCAEVWVFGNPKKSAGMQREIAYAAERKIPVIRFDELKPGSERNGRIVQLTRIFYTMIGKLRGFIYEDQDHTGN